MRDLAFASDGETLWIVSGDNDKSLPALQPTRLTAVRILPPTRRAAAPPRSPRQAKKNERLVSVWRTQSVPGAAAPLRLAVARGQPLASGTTIRMPPEKAAVFVTAVNDALFKLADVDARDAGGRQGGGQAVASTAAGHARARRHQRRRRPAVLDGELLSAVDLTPDAQLVVATAARVTPAPAPGGLVLDFGVTWAPIWGAVDHAGLPLARKARCQGVKPPFLIGDVRIQP